jgi:hypothetical protein
VKGRWSVDLPVDARLGSVYLEVEYPRSTLREARAV